MTTPYTTTQTGTPVVSDAHSLTVGADGATVLHDRYLVEKLAQFNRERIPERIVHAKGGGAFGEFGRSPVTCPSTRGPRCFQPGGQGRGGPALLVRRRRAWAPPTPGATCAASRCASTRARATSTSSATTRRSSSSATRSSSRTSSTRRSACRGSGLRDADMQWDFWTLSPESAHQVTYLMGDRGLPRSWRELNGYGSHTYLWTNAEGSRLLGQVPLHLPPGREVPRQRRGREASPGRTPTTTAATCTRRSSAGDNPVWDVKVQVMPYDDAKTYRFNPFDLTKVWPHADYPLIKVGHVHAQPQPEELLRGDRADRVLARPTRSRAPTSRPTRC